MYPRFLLQTGKRKNIIELSIDKPPYTWCPCHYPFSVLFRGKYIVERHEVSRRIEVEFHTHKSFTLLTAKAWPIKSGTPTMSSKSLSVGVLHRSPVDRHKTDFGIAGTQDKPTIQGKPAS